MNPAEIIVLSFVKLGICTDDLFRASKLDIGELFPVIDSLKSSGCLEEAQNIELAGQGSSVRYALTSNGDQKLTSVVNQLSDTWGHIIAAAGNITNNEVDISAFVKIVSDNEEWIYVMVLLGLISQDSALEIFGIVNKLVGKADQQSNNNDKLHELLKDHVENSAGSFVQYD
ncbi:MAG TPA: hypothetical protein VH415_09310 [Nitrososphaeraceae archaeon]|jgi:hypothetical protein